MGREHGAWPEILGFDSIAAVKGTRRNGDKEKNKLSGFKVLRRLEIGPWNLGFPLISHSPCPLV